MADQKISELASKTTLTGTEEFVCADSGTNKKVSFSNLGKSLKQSKSKSLTIDDPTASEDMSLTFFGKNVTITRIVAVLVGSDTPSVSWSLRFASDRSATGTEVVVGGRTTLNTTTGDDLTTFDNSTIVANSHMWIETSAIGGTVSSFHVTVFYDEG